jgi:hypothetical protein
VAPDEGVTGRPPLRLGRRRGLLHRGRRRHGPEKYPARWAPPLSGKVRRGRRRVSDAEPDGTIHQRSGAAESGAADAARQRLGERRWTWSGATQRPWAARCGAGVDRCGCAALGPGVGRWWRRRSGSDSVGIEEAEGRPSVTKTD